MATEIRIPEDLTLEIYKNIENMILKEVENNPLGFTIIIDSSLYMIESSIVFNLINKIYIENITDMFSYYISGTKTRYNSDRTFMYTHTIYFSCYILSEEQRIADKKIINDFIEVIKNKIFYSNSVFGKIISIRDFFKLNDYTVEISGEEYIVKIISTKKGSIKGCNDLICYLFNQLDIPYIAVKINNVVSGLLCIENNICYHVDISNDLMDNINLCLKSDEYVSTNYTTNFSTKIIGANFEEEISATNNKFDFYID